jgi:two-component system response regulator AtoC
MLTSPDRSLTGIQTASSASASSSHFVFGISSAMRALKRVICDIAPTEIPVLFIGESGTGKEMAALEIHRLSGRANEAFLKCNCGLPDAGSLRAHLGRVQSSNRSLPERSGGTLFLDEVHHLDPASQLSVLYSLPDNDRNPSAERPFARLISATSRNLEEEMHRGRFREELYFRINAVCLRLPPLRSRKDDIPVLLDHFLKRYAALFQRSEPPLKPGTMDLLMAYPWPGNVRELENVARKIVAFGDEDLALSDLSTAGLSTEPEFVPKLMPDNGRLRRSDSLKETARKASRKAEREMIAQALERTRWNRKKAARDLQVSYKALLYKIKQLGLDVGAEREIS